MANRKNFLLLICIIAFCTITMCASAALPMVGFPLKPASAEGPYQDDAFLEKANTTINKLSNQTVPSGHLLLDVMSTQKQIAKMSVSPDLYSFASDVNNFLYYTGKAGTEYGDALSLTSSLNSPVSQDNDKFEGASRYYLAAEEVWERINSAYPDVTLYTMPRAY